ncbi:cocaine- and amphetamine-regulated transcript protein-like [Limanda limanda]|uniref:cocaine- and amphetamine-regulated transcript protein-like n=1 Tax=Limanda limanda TaxID=27771 RepID=UPI0029C7EA3F|nr:cocaine- and amphetamine-regulated transcript protein-like [Limanda limanda]
MLRGRMLLLSASCWLLVAVAGCEELREERPHEDDASKMQEEKELIEALQEVLEKLKSKQLPSTEKKLGRLPSCDAGETCALRKGSRIGKLCGCPTGSICDFNVLKCL